MSPSYNTNLPGMNSRIKEIESLLRRGDVRRLGIWGIGGIGKTTLAQEVSKRISCQFESSGFAGSVRECSKQGGLNSLRQSLLSTLLKDENAYTGTCTEKRLGRKKLLIILDDVTNFRQIKHLIGDLECLSSESRIIVTSRDKQVLQNCRVHHIYHVEELCFNDALKLFCQHAFRQNRSKVDYNELSKSVVEKVGGVPLALEVLGSALFEKTKEVWESALKKLENNFDKDIHEVLKISYDELDDNEQSIFLDIACFFKGWNIDTVKVIMDACGFFDEVGISGLIDKSLITKSRNMPTMHDLLQAMGKEIVRQQSPNDPGKRTRLWCYKDIYDVLTKDKGTEMIEAISLNMAASNARDINLTPRAFAKMENLRLLNFYVNNILYNCGNKVHVPEDLVESDFTELKYFHWYGYPLKSLQQKFHFEKLVILEMHNSNIEELWSEGVQPLYNLKKIDLSWSHRLISCPDLSRAPNLEILKLDGCTSMSEIPSSIQHLSKVRSLYLTYCSSLVSIPDCTGLESLKDFFLYACSKLKRLPQLPTNLENIYLYQCTSLVEIQSSFTHLHKVQSLQLSGYESLTSIPDLRGLKSLTELIIYNCSKLKMLPELPNNIEVLTVEDVPIEEFPPSSEDLDRLRSLHLDNCSMLKSLPSSIHKWKSLRYFSLISCSKLKMLPQLPTNLEKIYVRKCTSLVEIQSSFTRLHKVRSFQLSGYESLTNIQYPTGLKYLPELIIYDCSKLKMLPDFPNSIEVLTLEDVPIEEFPPSLEDLDRLKSVLFNNCSMLKSLPSSVCKWKSLRRFELRNCSNFDKLPDDIGALVSLKHFKAEGTAIGEVPSSISRLKRLRYLYMSRCEGVDGVGLLLPPNLLGLENLYELILSDCGITKLPDSLGDLTSLERLDLSRNNFGSIPGSIINLSKLRYLDISYCEMLRELPQLPVVTEINAVNCTSLQRLSYFAFQNDIFETEQSSWKANFINCYNLDLDALNDVVKDTLLKIQGQAALTALIDKKVIRPKNTYYKQDDASERDFLPASIIYPGSKIPEWFHYQSRGSFIDVKLPPMRLSCNFLCFALCVVVAIPNSDRQCNHQASLSRRYSKVTYDCHVKSEDGNPCFESNLFSFHEAEIRLFPRFHPKPHFSLEMCCCGPNYMKSNHVIIGISFYIFDEICNNELELSFQFNVENASYDDDEEHFNVENASYDDEEEHFNVEMCGVHLMSGLTLSGYGITKLPDRLGDLTSLQRLVLNRDYFESIPKTIINLYKQETLEISYCERPRDLPQLPAGTHTKAMNCTSLERSSYFAFQNDIFEKPSSLVANLINCYNLDLDTLNDVVKDTMLKIQVQAALVTKDTLLKTTLQYEQVRVPKCLSLASVIYPESKIPVWFEYQSRGSSIDVTVPTNWRNRNFLCLALCVVVAIPNPDRQCNHSDLGDHRYSKVTYDCNGYSLCWGSRNLLLGLPYCGPDYMKSNHLIIWFGYWHQFFNDDKLSFEFEVENVRYLFCSEDDKEHFKVEMCGVHLISARYFEDESHLEESDEEDESQEDESHEDESHPEESYEEDEPDPKILKHIEKHTPTEKLN